uniref:Uncharacterized protein n=1 Tax=Vespula pensylvanica TaxID=30213 RepID=A0A834PGK0_VESPE|nr:hypothetical protein H0235_001531 [Vespula pensylvanica]
MKRNNGEKNLLKYKGESASEILKRHKDIDGPIEHRRDEEGKCRTKENSRLKVDQATIDPSAFDDFNVRSKSQVNKVIRGGRHAEDLSSVLVSFELYDKISCTNYDRYAEEKEERDEERWPFWCANFGQEDLRGVSNILDYSKDRKEDRSEGRKIGPEMLGKENAGIYESRVVHKSVLYYGKRGRTRVG